MLELNEEETVILNLGILRHERCYVICVLYFLLINKQYIHVRILILPHPTYNLDKNISAN